MITGVQLQRGAAGAGRGVSLSLSLSLSVSLSLSLNAELLAQVMADKRVKTVPAVNQCNHAIANHNESHNVGGGGDDKTVEFCKSHGSETSQLD